MADKTTEQKWIGFDLDGTLALYDGWKGNQHIGEPIPKIVAIAKELHSKGERIKIFTARVSPKSWGEATLKDIQEAIWKWCDRNLGFRPEITCEKDRWMLDFYDDRCHEVIKNSGELLNSTIKEARKAITKAILGGDMKYAKEAVAILSEAIRE